MIDLFGLEQQLKRTHDKPEAAALVEVLKAGSNGYQNCSKCEPRMVLFHRSLIVSNIQGYK
jgi:hypothetical protein